MESGESGKKHTHTHGKDRLEGGKMVENGIDAWKGVACQFCIFFTPLECIHGSISTSKTVEGLRVKV